MPIYIYKAPSSDFCHSSPDTPAPCFVGDNFTANLAVSDDLALAGVQAAECLTCPSHLESAVFDAIMIFRIRPIAVGEVLRRLASRLCCSHVKSSLPDVLLPYNQIGVGIRGDLEAGIHALAGIVDH